MTSVQARLRKLEAKIRPNAAPMIIDVVFVDAAKQPVEGFRVTVPMSGYAHKSSPATDLRVPLAVIPPA